MSKTLKKPNNLKQATENLQKLLPDTMRVGSGYGLSDKLEGPAKWRLYVYTDDKDTSKVPSKFEGFSVSVRGVPRAY